MIVEFQNVTSKWLCFAMRIDLFLNNKILLIFQCIYCEILNSLIHDRFLYLLYEQLIPIQQKLLYLFECLTEYLFLRIEHFMEYRLHFLKQE